MSPNREKGAISQEDNKAPMREASLVGVSFPDKETMVRKKPSLKAAWVLLFFCLLIGAGNSVVWAGKDTGVQLVLVMDLAKPANHDRGADLWSQAASLMVPLLKDQDYLGLAGPGEQPGIMLPTAKLSPKQRRQALDKLASFKPEAHPKQLTDLVAQSLKLFQPGGPGTRALLILSDGGGRAEPAKKTAYLEEIKQVADQARKTGITIFAVSRAQGNSSDELKKLTSATSGSFWEVKTYSDLVKALLNFYERLAQPQETPIIGPDFRLDPWVKQAVVVALRAVPGRGVLLTTPSGARITPRTQARTIRWDAQPAYDLITISQPRPGIWSLSGAQPAGSKVFLDTDLTLTAAGTPQVAGEDEALLVTAALSGPEKALAGALRPAGVEFLAELHLDHTAPMTTKLKMPEPGAGSAFPAGTRVGRFPPLHQEGNATLRISALGKNFQRSVELPIAITQPWYRVTLPAAAVPKVPPISFQPDPERRPQQVEGTVTLQSSQGSLAGVFINPAPGSEIIVAQPSGCQDSCQADLQLTGTAPGGRPLAITSGPRPLTVPQTAPEKPGDLDTKKVSKEKAQVKQSPPVTRKSKRRWVWLVLMGMGLVFFLVAGLLLWQERRGDQDEEGDEEADDGSGKNVLRLKAQVEGLLKEKAQLQGTLEEKDRQVEKLEAEKAKMQAELERAKTKSQGSSKTLEELEKRLEEAEREAKGFQQEYMALYARSQQDKETIKKN